MPVGSYWATTTSVLYRVLVWFYLRVIPAYFILGPAIPVVLVAYFASLLLVDASPAAPLEKRTVSRFKNDEADDINQGEDSNGIDVKVEPHEPEPVPAPQPEQSSLIGQIVTVAFTLPTTSKALTLASSLINTLLLLFCLDFTYTPYFKTYDPTFTRVGAVDSSSVKILVRYPGLEEQQLRIVYRQVAPGVALVRNQWRDGPVLDIEEEKDFTAVGKLTRLWPSSDYEYRFAYLNGTLLPYPEVPVNFHTFPDPSMAGVHFRFLASSCQLPNFPYSPIADRERLKGWDILHQYIWPPTELKEVVKEAVEEAYRNATEAANSFSSAVSSIASEKAKDASSTISDMSSSASSAASSVSSAASSAAVSIASAASSASSSIFAKAASVASQLTPDFMIFLGDFIYADVPIRGGSLDHYRKLYKRAYSSSSFRKVYERLPIFTIWDDHEISNNFEGEGTDDKGSFPNATSAYSTYLGNVNPDPVDSEVHYYDFRYGDNAFFVMDTRRYRTPSKSKIDISPAGSIHIESRPEPHTAADGSFKRETMLGDKQLAALHSWLGRVNNTATFKFIVSSVPFTSLWTGIHGGTDTWAVYLEERNALLDVLEYVPNVVILSGDRHEFAIIEMRGKVLEVAASPLSMFALPSYTLHKGSEKLLEKSITKTEVDVNGTAITVEAIEYIPEERTLFYHPTGQYKFASFDVDTTNRNAPTLKIEAIINGKSVKELVVQGKPVVLSTASALGNQITSGIKGFFNRIRLNPLKWM